LALLGLALSLVIRDVARESELSHLRSELVSGVSHELKTPLTLIRVFAETLAGDPVPPDPERRDFSIAAGDHERIFERFYRLRARESGQFRQPNRPINAYGRSPFDPTHEVKLLGTGVLRCRGTLNVSGVYRYATG
jgi:hypothetical protein